MKKILLLAAAAITLALASCDNDNSDPKDPDGTIPVNLTGNGYSYRIDITKDGGYEPNSVGFELRWRSPGDIRCISVTDAETIVDGYVYRFYPETEIASVGKVNGLWEVNKAPASGWSENMACVEENGYIVRVKYHTVYKYQEGVDGSYNVNEGDPDYAEGVVYARLFIEDELESGGSQNGVKIKMQYPFDPK